MSLIEQAAKRLEQLRQAGVELPESKPATETPERVSPERTNEHTSAPPPPPPPPTLPPAPPAAIHPRHPTHPTKR